MLFYVDILGCRGVVVIASTQLHSTKFELQLCKRPNPAHSMLEVCNGENF